MMMPDADKPKNETQESYYDNYWRTAKSWSAREDKIDVIERRLFAENLRPGMQCLDYGCGDGRRYGKLLQAAGVKYHGFDISAGALEQAASLGLRVDAIAEDGTTDASAGEFDAALCLEVLEHLLEPNRALREIHRLLKPGGRVILSVPNAGNWQARLEFLLTGFLCPNGSALTARVTPWQDAHIRFFNPSMLKAAARHNGFKPVALIGSDLDLGCLPYVYKRPVLQRGFTGLSRPVGWLGRAWPSLFAGRIFLLADKI